MITETRAKQIRDDYDFSLDPKERRVLDKYLDTDDLLTEQDEKVLDSLEWAYRAVLNRRGKIAEDV